MIVYCKVFVSFSHVFWDQNKDFIYIANTKKGYYPVWKNISQNMIMCMVVAEEAIRIENMDSEQIKDEI